MHAINRRPGAAGRREVASPGTLPAQLTGETDLRFSPAPRRRGCGLLIIQDENYHPPDLRARLSASNASLYLKSLITCTNAYAPPVKTNDSLRGRATGEIRDRGGQRISYSGKAGRDPVFDKKKCKKFIKYHTSLVFFFFYSYYTVCGKAD